MLRHLRLAILRTILGATLAAPLLAQPDASGAGRAAHLSASERRDFGRRALARDVAEHGRLNDPAARADVARVLDRLERATGYPGLDVRWDIVADTTVNAGTYPGMVMVIDAGLLTKLAQFAAADAPRDSASAHARYLAYLAAVLGHELAHATLGHPDSSLDAAVSSMPKRMRTATAAEIDARMRELLSDSAFMGRQRRARGNEVAADQLGALYLLRAGWAIQDAMDLMRRFDSWERASDDASLRQLSWITDHPRSSAREAWLESFRARLKLHQSELDDALTLVKNDVMLDSAVAMLDRVLVDFPELAAARHARAAALHRAWVNVAPVRFLQVRSSVPTFEARFIEAIRGAPEPRLLDAARAEYRRALAIDAQPYTLSNLAVLDAYAGDLGVARARADSASRLAPDDPLVANNEAAVLFLAGEYAAARDIFARLAREHDDWPSAHFNLGRALLALGDSAGARAALERYASMDAGSAWTAEAARLLGRRVAAAKGGASEPAKSGAGEGTKGGATLAPRSAPPPVAGVMLGETRAQVGTALGMPDATRDVEGGVLWHYPARGLVVGIDASQHVALVVLTSAAAGDVEGVRVGSPVRAALERWGKATERGEGTLAFDRGGWVVLVSEAKGMIDGLAVRRAR
jgi:predicted Zn-dependent protease